MNTPSPNSTTSSRFKSLFSSTDRKINIISLVLGIVALIITAIQWGYPEQLPTLIITRDILIVLSLIFIIVVLVISVNRRGIDQYRLRDEKEQLIKQIKSLQTKASEEIDASFVMIKNVRDDMYEHFHDGSSFAIDMSMTLSEYKKFTDICVFVADQVRSSLIKNLLMRGIEIDEDMSTCIKLILPSETLINVLPKLSPDQKSQLTSNPYWIITAFRDSKTYGHDRNDREVGEKIFKISSNTSFHNVIDQGRDFYLENNLGQLGPSYLNENTSWKNHYNATMIVPIKYKLKSASRTSYIGFITADSKNTQGLQIFTTEDSYRILRRGADLLSMFFLAVALERLQPPQESQNTLARPLQS